MGKLFSILCGLFMYIFTMVVRVFFILTALASFVGIGYCFFDVLSNPLSVENLYTNSLVVLTLAMYLFISAVLNIGMADILQLMNVVSSAFNNENKDATSSGSNTVVGRKGVFKR